MVQFLALGQGARGPKHKKTHTVCSCADAQLRKLDFIFKDQWSVAFLKPIRGCLWHGSCTFTPCAITSRNVSWLITKHGKKTPLNRVVFFWLSLGYHPFILNESFSLWLRDCHTVDGSEIPNNHLTCMKPCNPVGVFTISTGESPDFWTINRSPPWRFFSAPPNKATVTVRSLTELQNLLRLGVAKNDWRETNNPRLESSHLGRK